MSQGLLFVLGIMMEKSINVDGGGTILGDQMQP
jgi:hypothetical protein